MPANAKFGRRTYAAPAPVRSSGLVRISMLTWLALGALGSLALLGAVVGPQSHGNLAGFAELIEQAHN